jgi:hypothetical protein
MNCKWLSNKYLKDFVLESIKDKTKLPTPLNKGFCSFINKQCFTRRNISYNERKIKTDSKEFCLA